MNTLFSKLIIPAAIFCSLLGAGPAAFGWYWSVSTDVGEQVWVVAALDSRHVAAGTHSGKLMFMNNGQWDVVTDLPGEVRSIAASDDSHIWIGTSGGMVFFSNGDDFALVKTLASGFTVNALVALDADRVWAADPRNIYYFDGNTWINQYPNTAHDIYCLAAADSSHIWAGAQQGRVYFYDGISWSVQTILGDGSVYDLCVLGGGMVAAGTGIPDKSVFRSYDNGASWEMATSGGQPLYALAALNPYTAWAAGYRQVLHCPGGEEWILQTNPGCTIQSIAAAGNGLLVAGSSEGEIFWCDRNAAPLLDCQGSDFTGVGSAQPALFRPATGLWAVRGLTRAYFGEGNDVAVPGNYDGAGPAGIAVFRPSRGLWAVRNGDRVYYGAGGDAPVPADYDGDGTVDRAIFRPATGLWAIRGVTRFYFGGRGDLPLVADFTGDGTGRAAIYRDAAGLWAIRGLTRFYFGKAADIPATR